jgi:hypothetical protein
MVVLCGLCYHRVPCWLYVRLGGGIRGKWRILDGNGESGLCSHSKL